LILIKFVLPKKAKVYLYNDLQNRLQYIGYSYPMSLMKIKKSNFLDIDIFIPVEAENVLEMTYGEDWKVPNKNYIWYKEAKNLLLQD
jgi:hypothetical protein